MNIILNGESMLTDASTLSDLLQLHNIKVEKIACEVNGVVVSKSTYQNIAIQNNMKIEIINFVGGG